ncbi:MAG TPA: mannitol dehydrogenase family protein [Baekduia sp.]
MTTTRPATPTYRREDVDVGIVHVGVGGFHRAHQAMYVDRLLNAGAAREWGICGVGVLDGDRRMRDALAAQDFRYTLVEKHADGHRDARVIGAIVDHLFAPEQVEAVVERIAAPTTRIVSLTITEGGYGDAADAPPLSAFGLVTAALARRRARGLRGFTVMSCDNLPHNGRVARAAFTDYAARRDPDLAEWLAEAVRFPSSMVDRITPATTDADRDEVRERYGIEDRWPVVCEPFAQWVLEDAFSDGRPPLEDAGVQLVADVEPYETMKLRLLNAGHQALGHLGALAGHRLVHEAADDPPLARFLRRYMDDEATPTLAPVPGIDLEDYKSTLVARFRNREISDTLDRLRTDASDRIAQFVLPVIRDRLAAGGDVTCAAAIVAAWARGLEDPAVAAVPDRQGTPDPRRLLGELADHPSFAGAYASALDALRERGVRATLHGLGG